jgi:multiple sugar transport system substrate-binding protein
MSKLLKVVSILALLALVLAACQPPAQGGTTGGTTGGAQPSGEPVTVTIFVGMGTGTDPEQVTAEEQWEEEFNSSHDNIKIDFLIVPYEEARERYLTMIAGGTPPDLVGPNGVSGIAEFFDTWADIKPLIEADKTDLSDFYGPAVNLNEYPDKTVGLPLGVYPSFIIYNKDLFDASGVDYPTTDFNDKSWNLDKLREVAMQLTLDKDGHNAADPDFDPENIVQWGYDDSWATARGLLVGFGAPNLGRPTSEDYKTATANSEEWIYGLQWVSDGVHKDHFIADADGQTAASATGGDPLSGGVTAMFFTHTWFMNPSLMELPFEWNIAPVPFNQKGERIARLNADTFTIPAASKHQAEAYEVMKWLTSKENIVKVCLVYACVPARQSVKDEYQKTLEENYPGLNYDVLFESINYLDVPNHESWVPDNAKVEEVMNNVTSQLYTGTETDAKTLLDDANTKIQAILDEYWKSH